MDTFLRLAFPLDRYKVSCPGGVNGYFDSVLLAQPRNRTHTNPVALGEVARRLAPGDAPPRLRLLVRRELRLAPQSNAFRLRDPSAFVGAHDDPQTLVLGHSRQHRHEAAPHRGFEVDIAPVENPDRGSGVDHGLDDLQAIPHRARRPVPFGDHQLVDRGEVIERAGKFGASGHALARRFVGIDRGAAEALQRLGLPRQVRFADAPNIGPIG